MPFNNKSGDDHHCLWGFLITQVLLSQELMLDFIWKALSHIFVNLCTPREKPTSKSVKRFTQTLQGMEFVSEIRYERPSLVKYSRP